MEGEVKCPTCNAWSIVKDTRNQVTRRRECANGHRFTTKEVCIDNMLYEDKVARMANARFHQQLKREDKNDNVRKSKRVPTKA